MKISALTHIFPKQFKPEQIDKVADALSSSDLELDRSELQSKIERLTAPPYEAFPQQDKQMMPMDDVPSMAGKIPPAVAHSISGVPHQSAPRAAPMPAPEMMDAL